MEMCYFLDKKVREEMICTIGREPNETGGILGGSDCEINHFFFDVGEKSSANEYVPNTDLLNKVIDNWKSRDIKFLGIIHSHIDNPLLSDKDIQMALKILDLNPFIESILMPIFIIKDQEFRWYKVSKHQVDLATVINTGSSNET